MQGFFYAQLARIVTEKSEMKLTLDSSAREGFILISESIS
jgi:hypothetical protein